MNSKQLISFVLLSSVFAISDGPIIVTSSGIVPFVVSFNTMAGDGSQDATTDGSKISADLSNVTADDYGKVGPSSITNSFDIDNIIVIEDFDANHHVDIRLTKSGWILPTNYIGPKTQNGSDNTEFFVLVDIYTSGYTENEAEGLIVQGGFSNYTGLDNSEVTIIKGGTLAHGVENAAFGIDARILFDWLTDIPGAYTIQLTISVVQGG